MTFLYGACNSDEVPQESNSNSASNTDTDSNTNTESDSNTPATPGSVSDSESNTQTVPTEGTVSDSDSNDTSDSTPSTPSQADATNTNTESATDSSTESAGSDTEGDTDGTETNGNMCVAPPADDECETCLYENCNDAYCACAADEKCLCVVDCLEGVTGGNSNGLDDLLGLDLDDLLGGLLDDVLGDLLNDLTDQDFEDLTDVLECLTSDPCGVPLGVDLEDLLDGSNVDPNDLLDLQDLLNGQELGEIIENILEVAGNSLTPLAECAELTNPDGQCGTICPIEESVLDGQ